MTSDRPDWPPLTDTSQLVPGCASHWRKVWIEGSLTESEGEVKLSTAGCAQSSLMGVKLSDGVDLNIENLVLEIHVRHLSALHWMGLRLSRNDESPNEYVSLPLPCLKDIEANYLVENDWSVLGVGLAGASLDENSAQIHHQRLHHLEVQLIDDGSHWVDLSIRAIRTTPRPRRGCITLQFDDGYKHHLDSAAKILARFSTAENRLSATSFIMPRQLDNPYHLNSDDVEQLVRGYGWEIGAHHAKPLTLMGERETTEELSYAHKFLNDRNWTDGPIHFAYPEGKRNGESQQKVAQYFASARLITGGPETLPPADWHRLRAINVTPALSAGHLAYIAKKTIEAGGWAIYMFHHVVDIAKNPTEYSRAEFEAFLAFLMESKYRTTSMDEVYASYGPGVDWTTQESDPSDQDSRETIVQQTKGFIPRSSPRV